MSRQCVQQAICSAIQKCGSEGLHKKESQLLKKRAKRDVLEAKVRLMDMEIEGLEAYLSSQKDKLAMAITDDQDLVG